MADLLKTALIYDFDGTLARGNMQEVTFIPSVGMGVGDFWGEADRLTKSADGDNILMYMQLMLKQARENNAPITRKLLAEITPVVRSAAIKSAPSTMGAALESKFSEAELKEINTILESAAFKRFLQVFHS
jgi:hypothetical protein